MKRLLYMGSDAIGLPVLSYLADFSDETVQLVGVVSGSDRPAGRGKKMTANPIAQFTREHHLPLLQPEKPRTETLQWIEKWQIDLAIVFAYGHILRQDLLEAVPLGFLNLHGSLLPELRGPCPIEAAILQHRNQTGLSLMKLVREMDAGPVYGTEVVAIEPDETSVSLRQKMARSAATLLDRHLLPILNGSEIARPQDHSRATYTTMIQKADGLLNFAQSARNLEARVRAYGVWPGSFFDYNGERIRVGRAEVGAIDGDFPPGTFLGIRDGALEISTGEGILRCLELQRPTRRMLPAIFVWEQLFSKNGNGHENFRR